MKAMQKNVMQLPQGSAHKKCPEGVGRTAGNKREVEWANKGTIAVMIAAVCLMCLSHSPPFFMEPS